MTRNSWQQGSKSETGCVGISGRSSYHSHRRFGCPGSGKVNGRSDMGGNNCSCIEEFLFRKVLVLTLRGQST